MNYLWMIWIVAMIMGCSSGGSSGSKNPVVVEPTPIIASASETIFRAYDFNTSTDGWSTMAGANVAFGGGYLAITSRSADYDGAGISVSGLKSDTLYTIRLSVRPKADTSLNMMLKLAGSSVEYRQLTRSAAKAGTWTLMRSFVYLSAADIAKGLTLYINGDSAGDYDLDNVVISTSTYRPPTASNTADFLSASTARMKGINLIAYSDDEADNVYKFMNYSYYNFDRNDLGTIKSWGFDTIRLNLWYKYFETPLGFAWLDTVIGWAKEAGVKVILDMHAPQGGGFQGPGHITPFWDNVSYRNEYKTLWVEIATRYRHEPVIAAYDLLNEPCPHSQNDYITLMGETISAIRAVDTNHIINIENTFAADATAFHLEEFSNILYDFHFYDPWDGYTDHSSAVYGVAPLTKESLRSMYLEYSTYYTSRNLPIMVSEFGQKRDTIKTGNRGALLWLRDVYDLLDETNASYCYFSFKGNEFGVYDSTNALSANSNANTALIDFFDRQ